MGVDAHFAGVDLAAFGSLADDVLEDDGGVAGGVAAEEDESGVGGEDLLAEIEELNEVVVDFEELLVGAAAEAGGVEDDAVVAAAAADFAVEEFLDIVDDPADGCVGELVKGGVLACPVDHFFGRVEVADIAAGLGEGEGGAAGVGEEIEDIEWLFGVFGALLQPLPAEGVFGEDAQVAEVGWADGEEHAADFAGPFAGDFAAE